MKIGLIFCGFNCADSIQDCLSPWVEIKNNPPDDLKNLGSIDFVYSFVSVPFDKFEVTNIDNTADLVKESRIMDYSFVDSAAKSEIEARGLCLDYLKNSNCDIIWQVDFDEYYTQDQIVNIIKYIQLNDSVVWFKLCLKNFVFSDKQYLSQPFTPARIFRVSAPPFKLGTFRDDNNLTFWHNNAEIPDLFVKNKIIPKEVSWTKHLTWLNNSRSKDKVNYQVRRWGRSSFIWNDKSNQLEFNPSYYPDGKFPEVISENT